ncbi:MAG TPA: DUF547 domain-containing protein [Thermoanaerobaculia bacterium]|nr:DUF547 domain-containing protein [Thermoanaerobaculia bacterium]
MKTFLLALVILFPVVALAQEPDYSAWNTILAKYYDPAHGMDYANLKKSDAPTLQKLRTQLGNVNVAALTPKEQLAYWINVYNVNVVATIVENYPVDSIRDISTDPIVRLNVFKKERVPFGKETLSLDEVENKKIRETFHDPRIHFAINCAARSCPPIRTEAFTGARVDAQLDDQVRRFLSGPHGARFERDGDEVDVHVTKIVDWFGDDFEKWGGGKAAFLRRFVTPDKQRAIDAAKGNFDFEYDDYDWALNDWKR